jgi:hypothetical protein
MTLLGNQSTRQVKRLKSSFFISSLRPGGEAMIDLAYDFLVEVEFVVRT